MYPGNKKARLANGRYDFLFGTDRGKVMCYDANQHGLWAIEGTPDDLKVRRVDDVHWGDGTVTEGLTAPGGPYTGAEPRPGVDVTHVYIDEGDVVLRVVWTWTVTATLEATGETRTATLEPVERAAPVTVLEVRSVRDR